jgi:hypothetical protein
LFVKFGHFLDSAVFLYSIIFQNACLSPVAGEPFGALELWKLGALGAVKLKVGGVGGVGGSGKLTLLST